jgi:hypothetical protein
LFDRLKKHPRPKIHGFLFPSFRFSVPKMTPCPNAVTLFKTLSHSNLAEMRLHLVVEWKMAFGYNYRNNTTWAGGGGGGGGARRNVV